MTDRTLADRMKQGPLTRDQALDIALRIAVELETAHEAGKVHGGLETARVVLASDGSVQLRDGATGVAYQSPEQIDERPLDRRADIWSFGAIVLEMLSGSPALEEAGVPGAPLAIRRLVERCLREDPRARLRDIGDARVLLEETLGDESGPTATRKRLRFRAPLLALAVGACLGAVATWQPVPDIAPAPAEIARYSISLPPSPAQLVLDCPTGMAPPLSISPDGQSVAFTAHGPDGTRRLYLRTAADPKPRALPGTDSAELPFFSPDGKQIGFFLSGAGHLHRFTLADETVQELTRTSAVRGAHWGRDGKIVYADTDHGLVEFDPASDANRSLTERTGDELDHRWPQVLPDAKSVLFTVSMRGGRLEPRILSRETGEVFALDVQGSFARYVPNGFLIYVQAENIWAIRLDLDARKTVGDPVLVVPKIHISELGNPHFAISESGVLVYEPIRPPSPGRSMVWVNRAGDMEVIDKGEGYEFPRISPDRRWVLFANHTDTANHDVWSLDLATKKKKKLTNSGNYIQPIWSPDGLSIVFSSFAARNLHTKKLGASTARPLLEKIGWQYPAQWTRDNRLIFTDDGPGSGGGDVVELILNTMTQRKLVATLDTERAGTVSPDGQWLAYVSNETGSAQVYVRHYRKLGQGEAVSTEGGSEPVWSSDSRELFFRKGRAFFVANLPERAGQPIGRPKKLFEGPYVAGFFDRPNYDVSADGTRFVMVEGGWGLTQGRLEIHLQFDREIEAALNR
ncbi:MAG: hypothetical protein ACYS0E_08965 [Planctomycetota bacterium]